MLKLKLKRMGAPKKPYYRIVAIEDSKQRDGEYIDKIGAYDPTKKEALISFDEELTMSYLKKGAVPTDTVRNLLRKQGIWNKFKAAK
ncbi:MAG: 30S ribosomal protein S16 [Candidatus Wallbacteria bacterium]|nr:30S ribosomal protein S16 [Candidatus Wallbacteria bacterium]